MTAVHRRLSGPSSDPQIDGDPPAGSAAGVVGAAGPWSCAAVAGAYLGEFIARNALDMPLGTVWLAVAIVAAVVAARLVWPVGDPSVRAGATMLVVIGLVTAVGAGVRVVDARTGMLHELAAHGGQREATATVVREPRPIADGWLVVLRIDTIGSATSGETAVTVVDDPPVLGARWQATVSARPLPDGGYGRFLARQGAGVVVDMHQWRPHGGPGRFAAASEHVRDRVRHVAGDRTGGAVRGLLVGLVTGDVRLLPDDDLKAMRATSLTHLTAVSGMHVGVVAGGVFALGLALRLHTPLRRGLVAVTLLWFAFVTRMEPSVLRATTMALILLVVATRGNVRDARHALAVAVLLLVAADPMAATSVGLQLSAVATAGVLVVAPRVRRRLHWLPRRVAPVVAVAVGAQVAVLVLVLWIFDEVALASIPANVVAVPLAILAASLSFVAALVGLASPALGGWLFWVAAWPARGVLAVAHGFADLPGLVVTTRPATVVAAVAAAVWVVCDAGRRSGRVAATIAAVAVVVAVMPAAVGSLPAREFRITAIDVGQGDAFLIESPGARILVDAGGDETAARWLRANGRRHLDLVVVTHPHLDHVGGVAEVLRRVRVATVWHRPLPHELDAVEQMLAEAHARVVPVRAPQRGEATVVGDLVVEVLHPPPGRPFRFERSELNDSSLVVRITAPDGRRVLATGDVERAGQRDLMASGVPLAAEAMTVPHHGGNTSEAAFLSAVSACLGLIGVGVDNPHGHPHPDVVAQLQLSNVEIVRTDVDGTVTRTVPSRSCRDSGNGPAQTGGCTDSRGCATDMVASTSDRSWSAASGGNERNHHAVVGARDRHRRPLRPSRGGVHAGRRPRRGGFRPGSCRGGGTRRRATSGG